MGSFVLDLASYPRERKANLVPCKLNNAKTNKHLEQMIMFKFRLKSNLSQRKFLSKFARQIIQKLDL